MDANQTRLHLLLGERDWLRCTPKPTNRPLTAENAAEETDSEIFWDRDRSEITLRPKRFKFLASKSDRIPSLGAADDYSTSDRRGAARDRFGNWYYIAENRQEILAFSAGCKQTSHFWGFEDWNNPVAPASGIFAPEEPTLTTTVSAFLSGLAITSDHYLVVGTLKPGGLLVFDLHAGGPPHQLCWPEAIPFEPFDMAPRQHGGVWILDRHYRRYWALDRHLRVVTKDQVERVIETGEPDMFQAAEGAQSHCTPARVFPEGISLENASPIEALDPVSIETLPEDKVLILDIGEGGRSSLIQYSFGQNLGEAIFALSPPAADEGPEVLPKAYDIAFVGSVDTSIPESIGDLFVAAREGNQSFRFGMKQIGDQLWLESTLDYFPMRLFTGMGVVTAGNQAFYDSNRRWVPLVQMDRPQYLEDGTLISPIFDGRDPGCVWHRLLWDGCLAPGTSVRVWSRTSEIKSELEDEAVGWDPEPQAYRRGNGSELPFIKAPSSSDAGTFELLFQKARGRFLQIKLFLSGNGRSTPRLRALRIYYPRFSYLNRYLPAIYREDQASASFLDRFLANLEGINTAIEDRIAAAQVLFDLRSAPAETLAWLGTWFGMAMDPSWDEQRQRLLLRHAMHFFQWRGTIHGLQMALHLAFDEEVNESIFTTPGTRRSGRQARAGIKVPDCGSARSPDPFRVVEKFLLRRAPAVAFGEPDEYLGPKAILQGGRWDPNKGIAELRQRYRQATGRPDYADFDLGEAPTAEQASARAAFAQRELGFEPSEVLEDQQGWREFLHRRYASLELLNSAHSSNHESFEKIPIPEDRPTDATALDDWRDYVSRTALTPFGQKRTLWQDFLARRYSSVSQLNLPYGTTWPDFKVVIYPVALPNQAAQLWDWFKFESLVLPTSAAAHRFSVLLPFAGQTLSAVEQRLQQLELASRIVELEKPAHTTFDVKFYWALFRLGEARLGLDTTLGLGGRDPALLPPAVLGQTYLAETKLVPGHPFDVTERQVIGRDRLN
jgi:phage tail-like protein